MAAMSTRRDLFGTVDAELDSHKELKEVFNSVFDSCMPDRNDEVVYVSLLDALVSMRSSDNEEATLLKNEFNNLFRNRRGSSKISRRDFLKYLIAAKSENEPVSPQKLAEPVISPIETYEYRGRKSSSSESSELLDLERSFSSLSSSISSALPREREINRHLIRMGMLKDRKISKMEKELDDLRREMNLCIQNEEALKTSYSKKIDSLKEQLKDANENYVLCCNKADKLDDVENELYERTQQKKRLEKQLGDLEGEYKIALGQIRSLDDQLKSLVAENGKLRDKLQDEDALCLKIEQLREEKQELQMKLVNVSVTMCPNLLEEVSEDDISPDRMLISFPARERGMSIDQELSLLSEPFSRNSSPSSSHNVDARPMSDFLSTEEKSTSCSDLVSAVAELVTMTEGSLDGISPTMFCSMASMGTRTEAQREDVDGSPARTCCQRQTVSTLEAYSQTGVALMIPRHRNSKSTQTEFMEVSHSEMHPNEMARNHSQSSYLDATSSVSSATLSLGLSDILLAFVHTMILLVCALVFCIFVMNVDTIVSYVCNGLADFARKSLKLHYRRGIPPH